MYVIIIIITIIIIIIIIICCETSCDSCGYRFEVRPGTLLAIQLLRLPSSSHERL